MQSEREKSLGVRLKDAKQSKAVETASPEWMTLVLQELTKFSRDNEVFPAEDFKAHCLVQGMEEPAMPSVWGAVFVSACRQGMLRNSGRYTLPETPGGAVVLWESLVFNGLRTIGEPAHPATRWALKAEGQPALVFKSRPTAINWLRQYSDHHVVPIEEVAVECWTVKVEKF